MKHLNNPVKSNPPTSPHMSKHKQIKTDTTYLQWQRWYAVVYLPDRDSRYKIIRVYSPTDAKHYYRHQQLYPTLQEAQLKANQLNYPHYNLCNYK